MKHQTSRPFHQEIVFNPNENNDTFKSYLGLNLILVIFLTKMRWFPDNLMFFVDVVIKLYLATTSYLFFTKVFTSLYVILSSEETIIEICNKMFEIVTLITY